MVEESPWPIMVSLLSLSLFLSLVEWMWYYSMTGILLSLSLLVPFFYLWWRDVVRESNFMGNHSLECEKGFKLGMLWFISSEVFFFFAFFWGFFHSSLSVLGEVGGVWPPVGITSLDCFSVPLLNTAVLLSSGITVTWSHHSIMESDFFSSILSLFFTVSLGAYFTILQLFEYHFSPFSISDSVYGSLFFIATGFHGIHVIMGSLFLSVCLIRLIFNHFSTSHLVGFELASWYWHFVDVVWLFLFLCIYWWGS